jgi:hypothetical protein
MRNNNKKHQKAPVAEAAKIYKKKEEGNPPKLYNLNQLRKLPYPANVYPSQFIHSMIKTL